MSTIEINPGLDQPAEDALLRSARLQFEVEQFLYAEASLLDARKYQEWLSLLADDIRYWMPIRRTVTNSDVDMEFTKPGEIALFDDNRITLEMRVKKLEAGSSWSEDPPSRSRHFVTNVRVIAEVDESITAESCFRLFRSRLNSEPSSWTGRRVDVLRRSANGFLLARRELFLDDTIILAANMSTIF